MAKALKAPKETPEAIAAKLKAADSARNEARGDALNQVEQAAAEKSRCARRAPNSGHAKSVNERALSYVSRNN
jgi:hypothetical protein